MARQIPEDGSLAEFHETVGSEESARLEFKAGIPRSSDVQEEFVALANTRGGRVVFGMSDDRPTQPVGVEWSQKAEETVHQQARAVRPEIGVEVCTPILVDGKQVVVVNVPPVLDKWVQTSNGRTLVRAGPVNRTLFGEELAKFIQDRSTTPAEDAEVPGRSIDDLDKAALRDYLKRRLRVTRVGREHLVKLGLLSDKGAVRLATLLLFGKDPQSQFRRLNVVFARYSGSFEGAHELRERKEVKGRLPQLIHAADQQLYEAMRHDAVVSGLVREELPEFPSTVIREALANAVAHRDYSLTGSAVEVRLFDDAIQVESPGALPGHVTVDNIRDTQYSRNQRIMDALERLGLVEEAGQGVDRMIRDMEDALLAAPEFDEVNGSAFRVTLRGASVFTVDDRVWVNRFQTHGLTGDEKVALVLARRAGAAKNEDLRTARGLNREESRSVLRSLTVKGLLTPVGTGRGSRYVLGTAAQSVMSETTQGEHFEAIIRHAERAGSVKNEDVRRLLEVDATEALGILRTLVSRGQLEPRGEKRGRHYVLAGPTRSENEADSR